MNALNLRVSAVKTSDIVRKNAEIRTALVIFPTLYEDSKEWYCLDWQSAKTVPEQVACVKNIFQKVADDVKVLQFLCDLLVSSPLKHPVRNQIVKLFITASKSEGESLKSSSILTALENSLRKLGKDVQANEERSANWNTVIASISGCFENFETGLKSLELCIGEVFPFICISVDKYIKELTPITSPSVRNEYYLYIHNSIRVLLNCVQEFGISLKVSHLQCIQQLYIRCKQIILDGDIPMDPRTNAGILMGYIAKLNDEYANFVFYVKDIQNPHEIAMCAGVINTCEQEDFQQYSFALRDICKKIDEIANANATVPNILLCATRALFHISKLTLNFTFKSQQTLGDVKEILEMLMIFSVAFMEHHMDSVRHICRDIIRNVVAASKRQNFRALLLKIYGACNSDHLSLSVKCVILQQAANVLGADEVTGNCETLFTHLFAENLGRDFIVNNLYEALMLANYKEQPFEKWSSIWIFYLLNIASIQDSRLSDIEALIVKAVKCDARVVETIICNDNYSQQEQQIPISTKLSTLWAVRKSGIKITNFSEIMEKFSKHLQLSILSNDDDTRIMALRLLVETNKSTEPLTTLECDQFIIYLQYNSNCQSPATRQKSLSMLTKALTRCHVGIMKQMKGKYCKGVVKEYSLELCFLQDFMQVLIENLFEGANFSRRSVSLQLLHQCLIIGANCNLDLLPLLPQTALKALLTTLSDTYESNKVLAVNMLKMLETNQGEGSLVDSYQLHINLKELQTKLTCVKPTESVTASYQLELLCHRSAPNLFGKFEVPKSGPCLYAALKWLILELVEGLKLAEFSILEAAKLNPLYGLLFAVNHLMRNVDYPLIAEEKLWRNLIADLIILCMRLTHVVAPIVNSSSPEGHLPNDFSELPKELCKEKISTQASVTSPPCKILSTALHKINMASVKTTPQMVLLCAWRTVKEVSLILGNVVLYSDIQLSEFNERYLITKSQILEIGEHFKLMLSETKHRGAFEQAYVGFSKLCCRLWTVEAEDLNTLPMIWLTDLITLISQEDINNGKICATRRSAGVPFMVQALITSELKVGSTKALLFCMSRLLQLCSSKTTSSESRSHALNILRALFRCTDLSDAVGEYVAEGVMAAIRGYDANNWSEKNSSTLLFAALITRIFGVQRTKDSDNLNIRNRMTGRVFFLRYPKLYDFFLDELQVASVLIENQQKANKLHPLLLILSRLYPSALEGTESNLKLSVFIPYIAKCSGCPELQTRYLAGKAIVALVNKDEVVNLILRKCVDIVFLTNGSCELQLNVLHGCLLQIFYLIKHNKSVLNENLIADIISSLVTLHQHTQLKNAVILKVILDIFIDILSSLSSLNFKPLVLQQLTYFSNLPILSDPSVAFYYTVLHKSTFLYNLYIMLFTMPTEALSDYLTDIPLENIPLEQLETCLNVLLYVLALSKHKATQPQSNTPDSDLTDFLEEFEIMPTELQFVHIFNDETLLELSTKLKSNKVLYNTLKNILQIPKLYPSAAMKSYAILSFLSHFDFTLTQLLQVSKKQSDDVKSSITMCVERILQTQGVNYDCAELCLEYLTETAHPSQPYCLRLKAATSMAHIAVHYPKSLEMKRISFLRLYIKLMLNLLMDDDYDIRDFAAKLVLRCLSKDIVLTLCDKHTIIIPRQSEGVVSTVAQRVFLQYTAELLETQTTEDDDNEDDDFILNVFKIITYQSSVAAGGEDSQKNSSDCSLMDVEIFIKNEANVFAEPLTITMDAVMVFKLTFHKRVKVVQYVNNYMEDLKKRELVY